MLAGRCLNRISTLYLTQYQHNKPMIDITPIRPLFDRIDLLLTRLAMPQCRQAGSCRHIHPFRIRTTKGIDHEVHESGMAMMVPKLLRLIRISRIPTLPTNQSRAITPVPYINVAIMSSIKIASFPPNILPQDRTIAMKYDNSRAPIAIPFQMSITPMADGHLQIIHIVLSPFLNRLASIIFNHLELGVPQRPHRKCQYPLLY